jgi:hypothetical protein
MAAWLAAGVAAAQAVDDEATRARAIRLFEDGLAAFAREDYPAARDAFQASYDLRPNANVLFNLANAQRALYDFPASIASFRLYLRLHGAEVSEAERREIDGGIREMEAIAAQVAVEAPPGAGGEAARVPAPEVPAGAWGTLPVSLGIGANLRAMDFENRGFADNFFWALGGGVQFLDWLAATVDVVLPAVDVAAWVRFSLQPVDWLRLSAAPGLVASTGVWDDRAGGFAVALGLPVEFRLVGGFALWLCPAIGLDVTRAVLVVPATVGASVYL